MEMENKQEVRGPQGKVNLKKRVVFKLEYRAEDTEEKLSGEINAQEARAEEVNLVETADTETQYADVKDTSNDRKMAGRETNLVKSSHTEGREGDGNGATKGAHRPNLSDVQETKENKDSGDPKKGNLLDIEVAEGVSAEDDEAGNVGVAGEAQMPTNADMIGPAGEKEGEEDVTHSNIVSLCGEGMVMAVKETASDEAIKESVPKGEDAAAINEKEVAVTKMAPETDEEGADADPRYPKGTDPSAAVSTEEDQDDGVAQKIQDKNEMANAADADQMDTQLKENAEAKFGENATVK